MSETEKVINPLQKAFNYAFEINKDVIDLDERIIEGFATTEGIDREDQIVSLKAVEKALNQYMKNPTIRADHHPPPIGTTIFAEPRIKKGKKGLYIRAQIGKNSQACEDAWHGIQQKLYNAFSIGGVVKGISSKYSRQAKRHIQEIDNILISEISITDAPANQECMFEVISKSLGANGMEAKNMSSNDTETETEMSKELEPLSKRLDSLETNQVQTAKDITEIKDLMKAAANDDKEEDDKEKKEDEEEEKGKKGKAISPDAQTLKKGLEELGFTFPENPQHAATQDGQPPAKPETPLEPSPLTFTKMLQMKYSGENK